MRFRKAKRLEASIPFAAGGTVDIVARDLDKKLSKEFGQIINLDNYGSAGGTTATAMLAHAPPDGHTLIVLHQGLAL